MKFEETTVTRQSIHPKKPTTKKATRKLHPRGNATHLIFLKIKLYSQFYNSRKDKTIKPILIRKKKSLAIAESCTGGKIASLITSFPGSSLYFNGGIVAYNNSIKINQLGVDLVDLKK